MSNEWNPPSAGEIEKRIESLAKRYVPEWRYNADDPDIGSVIAQIFARQTEENCHLMSLMPERYHLEFVNMLDINLHRAQPAASMVIFNMDGSIMPGARVPKGTRLSAESSLTDSGYAIFETDRNIYVTESRIRAVFQTDGERGTISPIFGDFDEPVIVPEEALVMTEDEEMAESASGGTLYSNIEDEEQVYVIPPFTLFGEKTTIGKSVLTIYHDRLFDGVDEPIYIKFEGGSDIAQRIMSGEFSFQYLSKNGFMDFDSIKLSDDGELFTLTKSEECRKVSTGRDTYSVVIVKCNGIMTDSLEVSDIAISAGGASKSPEYVGDGSIEFDVRKFSPFTDTLAIYSECYIGHDACFTKGGARISMDFKLSFNENKLRLTPEQEEAELAIIKRKPKKTAIDNPAFVKVNEVIFEYYNGIGWKKLNLDSEYAGIFENGDSGDIHLSFICPEDWHESESGPYSGRVLRMRVVRADNCYMRPAIHTYPVIEKLKLSYNYEGRFSAPSKLEKISGTVKEDISDRLGQEKEFTVLSGSDYAGDMLYIGLDRKLEEGPISVYFQLAETNNQNGVKFQMEYSCGNTFKQMRFNDLTEDFTRSGTVMFLPPADMTEMVLEGNRLYWIRFVRAAAQKSEGSDIFLPRIARLSLNAVSVTNVQTGDEMDYYIDEIMPNMRFSLGSDNVLDAQIWVNEMGANSKEEMERMISDYPDRIRAEYDFLGRISAFYVLWDETDSFEEATSRRCYRIDRLSGNVMFADGTYCDMPRVTNDVAFKAKVRSTDGEMGNLSEGEINGFVGDAPYIDTVYNPIRSHGGNNLETLDHAMLRGAGMMNSRNKLVSETDYIRHIMEFSDSIDRARVVVGQTIDGINDPSDISIVLLMKDYADGAFSFHRISSLIKKDLLEHCELTVSEEHLHIVEPIFVEISVNVWATCMNMDDSFEVLSEVKGVLTDYLNPTSTATNDGWDIGVIPKESQLLMRLGVLRSRAIIRRVTMIGRFVDSTGEHELDTRDIEVSPFMVIKSGEHKVYISGK